MRRFVMLVPALILGGCVATVDLTTLVKRNGRTVDLEGEPYDGKVVRYHTDKQLAVTGTFRQGKRHGPWKRWDPQGRRLSEGRFVKGHRHGPWTYWHDDGKRVERGEYLLGVKHGTWSVHQDGKLAAKTEYADGKNLGRWKLGQPPPPRPEPEAPKPGIVLKARKPGARLVSVQMYVMSKCPFGVQAEQGMHEALAELGGHVDYQLDYIVSENKGKFSALHGEPEVLGNIQQLCARDLYPDQTMWPVFVACQNADWRDIPNNWEACAKMASMDPEKLRPCITGNRGLDLLRDSMLRSEAASAQGSPTIVIGGKSYQGGRSKKDFIRAICLELEGEKVETCQTLPPIPEVFAKVLTDSRCKDKMCNPDGLINNLRSRFFPKLTAVTVDYSTAEGKALHAELGEQFLPVLVFDGSVKKAEKYDQIKRWLEPRGKYHKLKIPAKFDPTAEICDNKQDDTGNGKVDCRDDDCKQAMVCRKENKRQLDVFIMSQCPFAVKGLNAMKEVMAALGKKVRFNVHFIASKKPDGGFSALHGQSEVEENIRMLCVKKLYPRRYKWLDYVWCRYQGDDWRGDKWQKCAKRGIRASAVKRCVKKRGHKLLAYDIKIAKALAISGSPTWLVNNKIRFNGISAEQIKTNFCKHNPKVRGCTKKLSGDSKAGGACGK